MELPAASSKPIILRREAIAAGLTRYFTGKPCPQGHIAERTVSRSTCVECSLSWIKTHNKINQAAKNKTAYAWERLNKDKRRAYDKKYNESHKHVNAEREARRRAVTARATPVWADRVALKSIYKACPAGHHVDHVVPLNGKLVCGLHVPWNLQYLTALDNCKKGNR